MVILNPNEVERFSRQTALPFFTEENQKQLKNAKVAIVGVGGLGSNVAMQLSTMGVGFLRLIDRDVVESSNLPRTPLFQEEDLDKSKAEAAKNRLEQLNSSLDIDVKATEIDKNNAMMLLEGVDLVIDGLDRFKPRRLINKVCIDLKIPYVFAGVTGTTANLATFIYKDGPCLDCIFGKINDDELPTCESIGVHTSAVIIASSIQVSEAIRIIIGKPPVLENSLLYIDLETLSFDHVTILKRENCQICGIQNKSIPFQYSNVVELCGRDSFMIPAPKSFQINISGARKLLEKKFSILTSGAFALTFQRENIKISLMAGGNALIRGVKEATEAQEIYKEIIKDIDHCISENA